MTEGYNEEFNQGCCGLWSVWQPSKPQGHHRKAIYMYSVSSQFKVCETNKWVQRKKLVNIKKWSEWASPWNPVSSSHNTTLCVTLFLFHVGNCVWNLSMYLGSFLAMMLAYNKVNDINVPCKNSTNMTSSKLLAVAGKCYQEQHQKESESGSYYSNFYEYWKMKYTCVLLVFKNAQGLLDEFTHLKFLMWDTKAVPPLPSATTGISFLFCSFALFLLHLIALKYSLQVSHHLLSQRSVYRGRVFEPQQSL